VSAQGCVKGVVTWAVFWRGERAKLQRQSRLRGRKRTLCSERSARLDRWHQHIHLRQWQPVDVVRRVRAYRLESLQAGLAAVYDLKTGWSYISRSQANAYGANLPAGTSSHPFTR